MKDKNGCSVIPTVYTLMSGEILSFKTPTKEYLIKAA